jgi:hypothetical protein
MDLPSPDDISAILDTPFVQGYWPLLIGGFVMIILLFRGRSWLLLPVGIAVGIAQAWHAGVMG